MLSKDVEGDFATVDQLARATVGSRCPRRVGATMVQGITYFAVCIRSIFFVKCDKCLVKMSR